MLLAGFIILTLACSTRLNQHKRLKTLRDCLLEVERTRHDDKLCSTAKAACIECDVVIKMHQQLLGDKFLPVRFERKLLPMRLERSDLDDIIKQSEYVSV